MNIGEGVNIGEHLAQFREHSLDMTPAIRGLAIDNFQFIKDIHNSFGRSVGRGRMFVIADAGRRKLDMLADDLALAEKVEESMKPRAKKRRSNIEEAALHFNAFLPLGGELFKLDGVEEQPCSLGQSPLPSV